MTKDPFVDPKVLGIFRSFVGVIVAFGVIGLISSQFVDSHISQPTTQIANLIFFVMLFLYLSFQQLQHVFGRFYLPLALASITFVLLIDQRIFQDQILLEAKTNEQFAAFGNGILQSLGDSWIIFLFLPLVLIAWQYRFRSVLIFAIGTALFDSLFTLQISSAEPQYLIIMFNTIASRTVAFILVGFIVVKLVAQQQKQQAQLTAANRQLSNYANILEKFSVNVELLATSHERNRLARELHDTLAHTLSALSVQLEATDTLWKTQPDQAQELLQNALSTTRSGLMETRRALQALRAAPLEDLGLVLAVRSLAESAAQRESFLIDLEISPQLSDLSPQFEQTIYRVIQEALENICRHAHAQHVSLSLTRDKNVVTALVIDDGVGFDLQTVDQEKKLGLRGMRERVEMLGGNLNIQSMVGKGTSVRLVMYEAAS